ncbi:MAG TPA: YihY/virulence factor BrkB family protein [Steroidobacteraceae bacterium]|jgi:membrane protein|nr:YihY/virulence factor BrkB family protein [Steroidobacteraceae bacterium]
MPARPLSDTDPGIEPGRGRHATHPREIPARGWRDILTRVKSEIGSDHVTLIAAGLAMSGLLAVFPGLAAAIAIYGLFASPTDVIAHMQAFSDILPPGTWDLFKTQLQTVASQTQGSLTSAAVGSLVIALWSARAGMAALMTATNVAYAEAEKRGFIHQTLVSLAFTVGAIVVFLLMLTLGVLVPLALDVLGTSSWVQILARAVRWVLLWMVAVLGLAVLYRYAPSREHARWHWVTWGSAIAATVWIVLSGLFAWYVGTFATYGKVYGALGGVIALLMWFYLTSLTIVIGAEINSEMERQTVRDTTEGPEAPLGERGARAADTVGPAAERTPSAKERERAKGAPGIAERGRRRS